MVNEQESAQERATRLATLKRQRTTLKASCTRIRNHVNAVATPIDPEARSQLIHRGQRLAQYFDEYSEIQTQIEGFEEVPEADANDREIFEDHYYALSAKISVLLQPSSSTSGSSGSASGSGNNVNGHESRNRVEQQANVRLPKLNLPTFSGKYEDWLPFYNTFNSLIHGNLSLTAVQKFQYLQSCLTGAAADVIHSLELSDANYAIAWTLLKGRFHNKRVIVHAHIREILELPKMNRENYKEISNMVDKVHRHVRSLKSLELPVDSWDDILVYILTSKLDSKTNREWQSSLVGSDLPTLKEFVEFLTRKFQALEVASSLEPANLDNNKHNSQNFKKGHFTAHIATIKSKCGFCNSDHLLYQCSEFLKLNPITRLREVRKRRICSNCLRSGKHAASACSSGPCKICGAKHNTLLHISPSESKNPTQNPPNREENLVSTQSKVSVHASIAKGCNLLSTARVYVYDRAGTRHECRVLLDSGSQANFITRSWLRLLELPVKASSISITGINLSTSSAYESVAVKIQSRINSFSTEIECLVTDRITDQLPQGSFTSNDFKIPRNIKMADPQFFKSANIDVLIGVDLFWDLLCVGRINATRHHPTLFKTHFGWIVAGRLASTKPPRSVHSFLATSSEPRSSDDLARFWELEDTPHYYKSQTPDAKACESFFLQSISQTVEGRFVVQLPVKEEVLNTLGDSRPNAVRRFLNLERRLERDSVLKAQYSQFMKEYLEMGHMREIQPSDEEKKPTFYLPHHCVFKPSSQTTKLRVVFDASAKSSSGTSLNDALCVGPVIQDDLVTILLRFRTYTYVVTADIKKMYRQILMHATHTPLHRILWRNHRAENLKTYELSTLTYGTSPASYLATKCLQHLAHQEMERFPLGAKHVLKNFYVDDLLTGSDNLQELKQSIVEIQKLLSKGCFPLDKWATNEPRILPQPLKSSMTTSIDFEKEQEARVLGIRWSPFRDEFHFLIDMHQLSEKITKRAILSDVSKIFDPLGLLGPVIMIPKLTVQKIWQLKINWDATLPTDIVTEWLNFKEQLPQLNKLAIPRCIKPQVPRQRMQLHGFCDACEYGYGACIYVRSQTSENHFQVRLLCSKSRVAPLKSLSLPRLELCAAGLLANLMRKVIEALDWSDVPIFLWSDSTITLNWIASQSRKWSTFVAHRVGEIQRLTNVSDWRHVISQHNPADALSRGLRPSRILQHELWWQGPEWLHQPREKWPDSEITPLDELPEAKLTVCAALLTSPNAIEQLIEKYSNLNKLIRVFAYCQRFIQATRRKERAQDITVQPIEREQSLTSICKQVQSIAFAREIKALNEHKGIDSSSGLLCLAPFLDEDGILRVGGRLQGSELPYHSRHPILLPKGHALTRLIIRQEHLRGMHTGLQATISTVRQRFWPISIRSVARKVIQECIKCFRAKPSGSEAIMGRLPSTRITQSRPFAYCGVDYAGPIYIREGRRRNAHKTKAYIAVFVCFAVKAVHLELVGDLTSEAFIAAFKRFLSRRGKVSTIYSDNGTNFVGANNEMKELFQFFKDEAEQRKISEYFNDSLINWSFIPPSAPHVGGLWEAAVKSAKFHLKRTIGDAALTFEELQTVLCEIEAILNSRPITPLSNDPNDCIILTPGHFLIGEALNSFPRPDLTYINEGRLTRWQRLEQIRQLFWKRWHLDYLNSLQERQKWKNNKGPSLKVGQLVLIRQENLAPLQWLMGRIQEIHIGNDEVARTATVKTTRGALTRPITKLCILPLES